MKIFLFLIAILFSASSTYAIEANIPSLDERLTYRMYWNGIPIGTGELWVKEKTTMNGKEVFHVVGIMQTNKVLSAIHPVHDEIHSWIDTQTLTSVKFEKKISEGSKRAYEVIEFKEPTHDVITAFYWMRRQALEPGGSVRTVVVADKKEWALEIVVLKRESLEIRRMAPIDTLLIEPRSKVQGLPEKKNKSFVHLSDDASKKPIKITYRASFGHMVGLLVRE